MVKIPKICSELLKASSQVISTPICWVYTGIKYISVWTHLHIGTHGGRAATRSVIKESAGKGWERDACEDEASHCTSHCTWTVHFSFSSFSSYHPGGSYRGGMREATWEVWDRWQQEDWRQGLCSEALSPGVSTQPVHGRLSCQVCSGIWEMAPVCSATVPYTLCPEICLQHWREYVSESHLFRKDPKQLYT